MRRAKSHRGGIGPQGLVRALAAACVGVMGVAGTARGGPPVVWDGLTLSSDYTVPANTTIQVINGLTLAGSRLTLQGYANPNANLDFVGTSLLGGSGEVVVANSASNFGDRTLIRSTSGTLTIDPGVTIRNESGSAQIGDAASSLVNKGTISSRVVQRFVDIKGAAVRNEGILEVKNGAFMSIGGNWTNAGTIRVENATLDLSGTFSSSDIGNIQQSGGWVNITGAVNNAGATLSIPAAGSWRLLGGTITGGTISAPGTAAFSYSSGILDGVTLDADMTKTSSGIITVRNGLTLKDHTIYMYDGGGIYFDSKPLSGTGRIVVCGPTAGSTNPTTFYAPNELFTIDPGVTIATSDDPWKRHEISIGYNNGSFFTQTLNRGTIIAQAPYMSVTLGGDWKNTGTLKLSDGTLNLGGRFKTSDIGQLVRTGGALILTGQMDNNNSTFALSAATGDVDFRGSITGGTISSADGAAIHIPGGKSGYIDNVTLGAPVVVHGGGALSQQNGLTLANAAITLISSADSYVPTLLNFPSGGNRSINGTGSIVFDASSEPNQRNYNGIKSGWDSGQLTLGPGITVRTRTGGGEIYGGSLIVNQGVVSAESAGQSITIGGTFTNQGIVRAINGASLTLARTNWVNTGTLVIDNATLNLFLELKGADFNSSFLGPMVRNGGNVNFTGTLDNTGFTLPLDAFGGWNLGSGGTIHGGTLGTGSETSPLSVIGPATLGDIAINADIQVQPGASLTLQGAWSNARTIRASNASITLRDSSAAMGSFELSKTNVLIAGSYTTAQIKGLPTNGGIVTVGSGGRLLNQNDTWLLDDVTGSGELKGGTVIGGKISASGKAQLRVSGDTPGCTLDGVTLDTALDVSGFSGLSVVHGLTLMNKPVTVRAAEMRFEQTQTLGGTGDVLLQGGRLNSYNGFLTIAPGVAVRMVTAADGQSWIGGSGLINKGTISGAVNYYTTEINPASWTNEGLVEVRNGARISFDATHLTNVVGSTLSGGKWAAYNGSSLLMTGAMIKTNAADILLSGATSSFSAISLLQTNTGSLTLADARAFKTAGALSNSGTVAIGTGSVLFVNGALTNTGTIDVNASLIVQATETAPEVVLAQLVAQIKASKIRSSAAAGDQLKKTALGTAMNDKGDGLLYTTFAGQTVDAKSVLVKYTWNGDSNLDGVVNADDYFQIDQGFISKKPGWYNGDFNYDGSINADDYFLIDSAFIGQSGPLAAGNPRLAAVPEPGGLPFLLLGASAAFARRRKHS